MDENQIEKAFLLVKALYEKTRKGEVEWREYSSRTFEASLGEHSLRLTRIPDPDYDDPNYQLTVVTSFNGKEIETITNASLRPLMDRVTEEGYNPYNLMDRTFDAARRQALGVDSAIDSVLDKLRNS